MGQVEILDLLKEKRQNGDNEFYSITEILKELGMSNSGTHWKQFNQLYLEGLLEVKLKSIVPVRRGFRIKTVYI